MRDVLKELNEWLVSGTTKAAGEAAETGTPATTGERAAENTADVTSAVAQSVDTAPQNDKEEEGVPATVVVTAGPTGTDVPATKDKQDDPGTTSEMSVDKIASIIASRKSILSGIASAQPVTEKKAEEAKKDDKSVEKKAEEDKGSDSTVPDNAPKADTETPEKKEEDKKDEQKGVEPGSTPETPKDQEATPTEEELKSAKEAGEKAAAELLKDMEKHAGMIDGIVKQAEEDAEATADYLAGAEGAPAEATPADVAPEGGNVEGDIEALIQQLLDAGVSPEEIAQLLQAAFAQAGGGAAAPAAAAEAIPAEAAPAVPAEAAQTEAMTTSASAKKDVKPVEKKADTKQANMTVVAEALEKIASKMRKG